MTVTRTKATAKANAGVLRFAQNDKRCVAENDKRCVAEYDKLFVWIREMARFCGFNLIDGKLCTLPDSTIGKFILVIG
jgi:hypothetical protein